MSEMSQYIFPEAHGSITLRPTFRTTHIVGSHFHHTVEIMYAYEASLRTHIGNNVITLEKGDVILINQNVIHRHEHLTDGNRLFVHLDADFYLAQLTQNKTYGPFDNFIKSKAAKSYLVLKGDNEIKDLVLKIWKEAETQKKRHNLYIKSYCYQIVSFMCRNDLLSDVSHSYDTSKIKGLLPVIEYIEENYQNKIYLEELAKIVHVDKYTLCKLFKAAAGQTIVDYINFFRLMQAKEKLLNTEKSISEIALECGFASVSFFNRVFKNNQGCTPGEYKKHFVFLNTDDNLSRTCDILVE